MTTLHYFSKTLLRYFVTVLGLGLLAFCLFVGGFFYLFQDNLTSDSYPSQLYDRLIVDDAVVLDKDIKKELDEKDIWLMVLNENGNISQDYRLPKELDKTYSRSDIASFSRWYLEDYPVFTYLLDDQIVVLGYPKDSYTRIGGTILISAFDKLFHLLLGILAVLLVTYFTIYWRSHLKLLQEITPITQALQDLSHDQPVLLDEKGNLSEIKAAINQTSHLLQTTKDMQSHWIRGVTHDLRTPLTLALGYTDQLEQKHGNSKQTQQLTQSIHRMETIIDNLNMVYHLQSQEMMADFQKVDLAALVRQTLADFLNNHEETQLELDLPLSPLPILANPTLLSRAMDNSLLNSIHHNHTTVPIAVHLVQEGQKAVLTIADKGAISPEKIAELTAKTSNYQPHGMGTLISKQIVALHHGNIQFAYGNPGLILTITLPLTT